MLRAQPQPAGLRTGLGSGLRAAATTRSIRPIDPAVPVRPLVIAYGRTTGPASWSSHRSRRAVTRHHPATDSWSWRRGGAVRYLPIRRTSMAIS